MKKIKNLFLISCMVAGAFLLPGKNVNAEEFKPQIAGTLTNAGDSVKVKDVRKNSPKYIKYVSSTDELMYVYTDSESKDPVLEVLDKNGRSIQTYDNIYVQTSVLNENSKNSEIFIKLKKGEEYYLSTYINDTGELDEYNVNLIKAVYRPEVKVYMGEDESEHKYWSVLDDSCDGLKYDEDNYTLYMENTDISFLLYINCNNKNIFSDGLLEINVLGENTITLDYSSYIVSNVSVVFKGNGSLTFITKTETYVHEYIVDMDDSTPGTVLRVDGPTLETSVETNKDVFTANKFVMDSGKFIYSGISNGDIIDAITICINGGEIYTVDADSSYDSFSSTYMEINGGTIRTSLKPRVRKNIDNTINASYNSTFFGGKYVRINGGTIFVDYIEPELEPGIELKSVYAYYMIESRYEVSINGGNIYVVIPDMVKEALDNKIAGFFTNYSEYDPANTSMTISEEANIVKGSALDISLFKCSLEYTKCVYDGKEKKPVVTVKGLVEGTDYTVTYSNNVNPGTAKVTVTGRGDFTGKKEFTFVIEEIKNDDSSVVDSPKEGTTIKDKKYIYKVTKAGSKDGAIGEVMVTGLKKKSLKEIKIATKVTIDGITYKVTSIGANAFKGNKKITKVTIGKNVKTIGSKAFYNCKKLKNVRINSKKLKKIGKKAFFKKKGKKITFKVPKAKKKAYKKKLKTAKTKKFVVK